MPAQPPEAVFITGAATGIGAAAARKLAEQGYRVFAGVRTTRPAGSVTGIEPITIDVTDPDSVADPRPRFASASREAGCGPSSTTPESSSTGRSSSYRSASWSASSRSTRSDRST